MCKEEGLSPHPYPYIPPPARAGMPNPAPSPPFFPAPLVASGWLLLLPGDFLGVSGWLLLILGGFQTVALLNSMPWSAAASWTNDSPPTSYRIRNASLDCGEEPSTMAGTCQY